MFSPTAQPLSIPFDEWKPPEPLQLDAVVIGSGYGGSVAALRLALAGRRVYVIAVSNEVGLGIVPDNALGRRFRDEQGQLNQQVAAIADSVVFVAAGLPLALKGKLP